MLLDINLHDLPTLGAGSAVGGSGLMGLYFLLEKVFKNKLEKEQEKITKEYEVKFDKSVQESKDFVKIANENTQNIVKSLITALADSNKVFVAEFSKMNEDKFAKHRNDFEGVLRTFLDKQEEHRAIMEKRIDKLEDFIFALRSQNHG